MEWAWNRVATIKQSVDKDSLVLFDQSCDDLPDTIRQTLVSQCRQLQHLKNLIADAIKVTRTKRTYNLNIDELDPKWKITCLIKMYVDVILWFFGAGLLPENAHETFESAFPAKELANAYAVKRRKLRARIRAWFHSNSFRGDGMEETGLLVDGLCDQLGQALVVSIYISTIMKRMSIRA